MVAELTGSSSFTYITAVTKVVGSRAAWQDNATFRENLGGNPIEILTFGDILKELFPSIDTTPASSEVGRVLQADQGVRLVSRQVIQPEGCTCDGNQGLMMARCSSHSSGVPDARSNRVTSGGNVSSRIAATMSGARVVRFTIRLT